MSWLEVLWLVSGVEIPVIRRPAPRHMEKRPARLVDETGSVGGDSFCVVSALRIPDRYKISALWNLSDPQIGQLNDFIAGSPSVPNFNFLHSRICDFAL